MGAQSSATWRDDHLRGYLCVSALQTEGCGLFRTDIPSQLDIAGLITLPAKQINLTSMVSPLLISQSPNWTFRCCSRSTNPNCRVHTASVIISEMALWLKKRVSSAEPWPQSNNGIRAAVLELKPDGCTFNA